MSRCALSIAVALGLVSPAWALIQRLVPLQEVITSEQLIFPATVEKADPDRPALILTVGEPLKGKPSFARMPINMTGDAEAAKLKHVEALFERLPKGQTLLVFASQRGRIVTAFAYAEGTWFQLRGTVDGDAVRWALLHGEPYLRKTFAGTTAELTALVRDVLAERKKAPEPDPKAAPGFGPKPTPGAARPVPRLPLAVIPTFVLVGPAALLAALFPAVFGGLALVLRRWTVLLSIAGLVSTLFVAAAWGWLPLGWRRPDLLWMLGAMLSAGGALWAVGRYASAVRDERIDDYLLGRFDRCLLIVTTVGGGGWLAWLGAHGQPPQEPPWQGLTVATLTAAAGTFALLARWSAEHARAERRLAPTGCSVETVMLWAMTFACASLASWEAGRGQAPPATSAERHIRWTLAPNEPGSFFGPAIADGRLYVPAQHGAGFGQYGMVYAVDAVTGETLWRFDNDGDLKPVFCTPCIADGRVYVGEGFHQDSHCRLFCLDATTGEKRWEFATASHTEATPFVAHGRVWFGAGDDGIWCLDAATGQSHWHFTELHVDANVVVADGKLYAGSGVGDLYNTTAVVCLDATTGRELWRTPTDLPAFGSPVLAGDKVVVGTGRGNLLVSDDHPAGAVVALAATSGQRLWRADVPDAVLNRPTVVGELVIFGSRDGRAHAVSLADGRERWTIDAGSPVVADVVPLGESVLVAGSGGRLLSVENQSGRELWSYDIARTMRTGQPMLLAAPVSGEGGRVYVALGVQDSLGPTTARLLALEEAGPTGR